MGEDIKTIRNLLDDYDKKFQAFKKKEEALLSATGPKKAQADIAYSEAKMLLDKSYLPLSEKLKNFCISSIQDLKVLNLF